MLLPAGDRSRRGGVIMSIEPATPVADRGEGLGGEYRQGLAGGRSLVPDTVKYRGGVVDVQSRVSSATAFLAQASSTRSLLSAAPAMMAAVAALLRARGRPPEARCSRATASSAKSGSWRPARAR